MKFFLSIIAALFLTTSGFGQTSEKEALEAVIASQIPVCLSQVRQAYPAAPESELEKFCQCSVPGIFYTVDRVIKQNGGITQYDVRVIIGKISQFCNVKQLQSYKKG